MWTRKPLRPCSDRVSTYIWPVLGGILVSLVYSSCFGDCRQVQFVQKEYQILKEELAQRGCSHDAVSVDSEVNPAS